MFNVSRTSESVLICSNVQTTNKIVKSFLNIPIRRQFPSEIWVWHEFCLYWNSQFSTTCQLPLIQNLFVSPWHLTLVKNDARFFGSLWSGNRRRQCWKIASFMFLLWCFNFVSCYLLPVRSVAGFDMTSFYRPIYFD